MFNMPLTMQRLSAFDATHTTVKEKEKDKSNSRRAAYNALVRLKENSQRLALAPEKLRRRLLDGGVSKVPSDLVSMLVEQGGDIAALQASFQAQQEQETEFNDRQAMVPMTEQQVISIYGSEEAKRVMASKRAQGLVQADRNSPGKDAFLMYEDKKELNVVNRSRH